MKIRIDKFDIGLPRFLWKRLGIHVDAELQATEDPAMTQVDGLWIHQGAAKPDANWECALNNVRAERIRAVSKP